MGVQGYRGTNLKNHLKAEFEQLFIFAFVKANTQDIELLFSMMELSL